MTDTTANPRHNIREIRSPRGSELNALSWQTEAPLRMLMNNLDPDVAENPNELVVYGGIGRAARNWDELRRASSPSLKPLEEPTRRCWCSRASRSGSSAHTQTRRAC